MRKAMFWIALVGIFSACRSRESWSGQEADLVIRHARIYTVEAQRPWAQAVAIKGDHIRWVGDDKDAGAYIGPATKVMEAYCANFLTVHICSGGHREKVPEQFICPV